MLNGQWPEAVAALTELLDRMRGRPADLATTRRASSFAVNAPRRWEGEAPAEPRAGRKKARREPFDRPQDKPRPLEDPVLAPVDPVTTLVDLEFVRAHINPNTVALVGSAGNYPYGTIDPIAELSALALQHEIGLHVDGCLGGFILPWGEQLGYDIPIFDFRLPGVTSISADTHKYGYGLKGTSVVMYRDRAFRTYQYFLSAEWPGGKYFSPGLAGSRSGGLLAATWASMMSLGRQGYLRYAKAIFETAFAMQKAVCSHPELRLMGKPTWCFSFTADAFDIYHVNDFMKTRGWRFNGQQYPNAIHMCVTRPQTQPGVGETFAQDLAEAVRYALNPPRDMPATGAIYGGAPKGIPEVRQMITDFMVGFLDASQDVPREP